ncbi:MAG: helix-turn-helix domain-containing protein [Clostridia bacterium]|nr:helix-turn-helix domain-containing protein [Clostridia bacterium]
MITPETIGKNLVYARCDFGYTQKELADKLAVSPQNISKWERGISVPDVITLLQISELLNKDITYFLVSHSQEKAPASRAIASVAPVKYVDSVFSNTNWYKQRLCEIKRNSIYLCNSIMRHTEFISSAMDYCKIKDCELSHCSSVDSKLQDTDIQHCFFRFMKIKNTSVSSCKINAAFYRCNITDSNFSAIVFDNCNFDAVFENCTFSRIAIKNCKKARHCSFINCEMDKMSEQAFRESGAIILNCTTKED